GSGLTVEGTLSAVGTSASPIVLTSLFDSSVGGNSTGTATSPHPGDWSGVVVSGAGSVNLQHATVSYGAWGVFGQSSKAVTLVGDKFMESGNGAVYLDDGQSDTVKNNTAVDPGGLAYLDHGPA